MDLKEDTTMDKIYGWKLKMKIADGNCGWSALGLLDAGPKSFKIRRGLEVLITGNNVFCKKGSTWWCSTKLISLIKMLFLTFYYLKYRKLIIFHV